MKEYVKNPKKFAAAMGEYFDRVRKTLFDEDDNEKIALWIKYALKFATPTAFAFTVAQKSLPFATYPLGLALMAAAGSETLVFFIGTLIFAILSGNIPTLVGSISLIIIRFIFARVFVNENEISKKEKLYKKFFKNKILFLESESLRISTAAVGAFTAGMMNIVLGGFSFGDLIGTCFSVVVSPALAYLYTGYLTATEKRGTRYETGFVALLVTFIFAISEIKPIGISLSVIFASLICFLLAKRSNPFTACMFALLSVLAAEPLLSPAFALGAALAAFLYPHSKLYSITIGSISFAALSYFIGGLNLFVSFFPEFMTGALISAAVKEDTAEKLLPFFCGGRVNITGADTEILSYKEKKGRESISDISKSFEELSKAFFDLSDKNTRLGIFDTRHICDKVCDKYCRKCSSLSLCWERDYAITLDTVNKISAKIYKNGRVELSDLSSEFKSRCHNAERLIDDIEKENRRVIKSMIKEDKTRAFAVDYAVFAKVLSEALKKNEAEYAPNSKAREAVIAELSKIGFSADSIGVYGGRCKNIYAFRISKNALKCKADEIKKAIGNAIFGRCDDPTFEFADGGINMICRQAPSFKVSCSLYSFAAERTQENGDRVAGFDGKNGYYYALVNDGMGSGRAAAKKSGAASVFLEKMLRAGNSAASGIEMLSSLARADGEEGFTTLDLFEFDTLSGKGSFIKSGAAPSFVKRGSKLFKIRSKTFPLGILEDVDAERTTFDCENGDKIIILSDGVTEDIEEPLWLCEYLTSADLSAPDAAKAILMEARRHTLCRDDMTAAVISVENMQE